MADLISQHGEVIGQVCQRHGVGRLWVFGSLARDAAPAPCSDADFLVEFLSDDWHGAADRWFGLIEDLESLLGRPVELTSAKTATNPYFLASVSRDRVEIYAAGAAQSHA